MAVETEALLVAVGVIVVGAFFAGLAFRFLRIPDIVFLIALGVVLGPLTHTIEVELFEAIAPFVGTVALVVILFEGGLKINRKDLVGGVGIGALLALAVFALTAFLCALVGFFVLQLPLGHATMLGMAFGGAGAVIVIPLIQRLGVGARAQTIVSIEAAVSDVIVVLGVVGLATAIAFKQDDPTTLVQTLMTNFSIGILVGVTAGFGWVAALRAFEQRSVEYVLTIAILFLLYAATEFVKGSGPLAILLFGLVVGNSRKTRRVSEDELAGRKGRRWEYIPVFGEELHSLQHEVVFFLRAFFFVSLGVIIDLSVFAQAKFVLGGVLLAVAVGLGRYVGCRVVLRKSTPETWDRLAVALMFPLGLAAAVTSLIPWQRFGIEGTEDFGGYAVVAIVVTNLAATVLVFAFSRPAMQQRLRPPAKSKGRAA